MLVIVALTASHIGSVGAMFPFAGMCVSLAVPTEELAEFSDRFAVRSIGLIGYNICFAYLAPLVEVPVAIALRWLTYFVLLTGALTLKSRYTSRHQRSL